MTKNITVYAQWKKHSGTGGGDGSGSYGQVRDIEPVITVMEAGKKHVLPVAEMVICKGQTGGASDQQLCRGGVQRRADCATV